VIIGSPIRTSCVNATLVNGIMGHALELDDVHGDALMHPGAPVMPASLAIGELAGASGKELITSVVVGYETEARVGSAVNPSHYQYWHTTGTCGTFGAAAASGRLLRLDQEKMVNTLGIAGTQAAGLIDVFGTMCKPLNAGRAARDGVMAALLAREGFTSTTQIFESPKGFCKATSKEDRKSV